MKTEDNKKNVFLDYASSTPICSEVISVMNDFSQNNFSNPSALYSSAIVAKERMNEARQEIAQTLGATSSEIIFTSGGTESNNLALLGIFEMALTVFPKERKPHFIVTAIEHPAILEVCNEIERRGGEITIVSVEKDGIVSPKDIISAITENTVLVSVMYANNEIGTIQPLSEISHRIKEWRREHNSVFPYFHSDACQAALYCPTNILKLGVDMMTFDGIKMYGPRGMGVLYKRNSLNINPLFFGGGQEKGIRSGTENVGGIIGLAKSFTLALSLREVEVTRLTEIREYAFDEILKHFPNASVNGSRDKRLPNNVNICFPGIDAEFTVISLDVLGISASYSSVCRTLKEDSTSYVVEALGKKDCAMSSLRFTLGRETTKGDIDYLVDSLIEVIK